MKDPYDVLGVQKTDSESAIRTAYRKLAKKHHPDLNPGKPEAAERFKEITAAHDILSDADKRARYDRGEIDAAGNEVPPQRHFYRDFGDGAGREKYQSDISPEDLDSIFAHAFGDGAFFRAGGGRGQQFQARGADAHYTLTIGFLDAANGTTRRITLPEGRTLDVRIPAGVQDGHVLRLKGSGHARPGRRSGRRRVGGNRGGAASAVPPRRRRHHRRTPRHGTGSGARRLAGSTHDQGQGAAEHPAQLRHRHAVAAARPRHPPGPSVRAIARRAAANRRTGIVRVPEELEAASRVQSAGRIGGAPDMQITAVTALFTDLGEAELVAWVERGWVLPEPADAGWVFHEIDIARVRLIHDLRRQMEVGEDNMSLVLSLLDHVYELRGRLHAVLRAVDAQPEDVRAAIRAVLLE